MIVTINQTVLQWQYQGIWDGLCMQRSWKRRKVQTVFYCGNILGRPRCRCQPVNSMKRNP